MCIAVVRLSSGTARASACPGEVELPWRPMTPPSSHCLKSRSSLALLGKRLMQVKPRVKPPSCVFCIECRYTCTVVYWMQACFVAVLCCVSVCVCISK